MRRPITTPSAASRVLGPRGPGDDDWQCAAPQRKRLQHSGEAEDMIRVEVCRTGSPRDRRARPPSEAAAAASPPRSPRADDRRRAAQGSTRCPATPSARSRPCRGTAGRGPRAPILAPHGSFPRGAHRVGRRRSCRERGIGHHDLDNHPQGHPRCPDITLSPKPRRDRAGTVPSVSRERRGPGDADTALPLPLERLDAPQPETARSV